MWTKAGRRDWIGLQVDDVDGMRIGTVRDVVVDPETGLTWLLVGLGRFVRHPTLVPATGAGPTGAARVLTVPVRRFDVREAPRVSSADEWRTGAFRARLYRHYGLVGLSATVGAATV